MTELPTYMKQKFEGYVLDEDYLGAVKYLEQECNRRVTKGLCWRPCEQCVVERRITDTKDLGVR